MNEHAEMSLAAARSRVYAFLARAFADPAPGLRAELEQMASLADSALSELGATQSRAACAALRGALDGLDSDGLAAAHRGAFGHTVSGDCSPYEGEYGHAHIFQKTQCLADNGGYYRAFGLEPAPHLAEREDHISVQLEFLHVLAAKEAYALAHGHGEEKLTIVRDATRNYLRDHLGRWAPGFAARLSSRAQGGFYGALAGLLAAFANEDACALGVTLVPAPAAPAASPPEELAAACEGCPGTQDAISAMRGEP